MKQARMKKSDFLGPNETYEIYEKRAHSPAHNFSGPIYQVGSSPIQMSRPIAAEFYPASSNTFAYIPADQAEKRKVPLPWIIGLAIIIPIFVILILFLAVWLQEMGII